MSRFAEPARAPDFDRLAPVYRWMEWLTFGPWLGLCRFAFLPRLADRRRALVLGDGDGRFTARLLQVNPELRIDAVDASPSMLRALERRAGPHRSRLRATAADVRLWQPSPAASYDLVATHFFLDCLTAPEIRSLAAAIRPALAPGALWVISEFDIPPNPFGRLLARPLVSALYYAFGLLTGLSVRRLPDHRGALRSAGFTLLASRPFLRGLLAGELWTLHPNP